MPNEGVVFTVGGEKKDEKMPTTPASVTQDQPSQADNTPIRSVSRFRVAKVEFANHDFGCSTTDPDDEDIQDEEEPHDIVDELPLSAQAKPKRKRRNSSNSSANNSYSQSYETRNLKTFGRNTLETLPHLDHYRNLLSATAAIRKRPTLYELHNDEDYLEGDISRDRTVVTEQPTPKQTVSQGPKFGWIQGVLVRCLLNIWGVMLFLRLSWVVGQAGIGLACCIILLATVVTIITALSMSAICTNGEVRGGGAYYMISRSLGPEFGGAIGLIFSLANAVAVAMYVVGFAETIRDLLKDYGRQMVDDINDVRIIGIITVIGLLGIVLIGMDWEARAQIVLLIILLVAIANFIVGVFIPPSKKKMAKGFVGIKESQFGENFGPDFRDGEGFFSVFAIFFPAATGILAGANISGDLKNAQTAIPKGTLLAIIITSLTYLVMAILAGAVTLRDASGQLTSDYIIKMAEEIANNKSAAEALSIPFSVINNTSENNSTMVILEILNLTAYLENDTVVPCEVGSCDYGLLNNMSVMSLVSGFGPLILAGIICATISSALASLVGAPKVFQAVCMDNIFPGIYVFAKGYGKGNEPVRAYVLTFFIALGCICIGSLNAIAPLISNFFLISYALVNYSCFDASLAKSPGWRPAFKYYSMWVSLLGAILCLAVMFVINWWTALITFAVVIGLYLFVHYKKPEINWGSSTQAHQYRSALTSCLKLQYVDEHVKNFRPATLVLSGHPRERPALVDFVNNFTRNVSLMVCGHVLKQVDETDSLKNLRNIKAETQAWIKQRKVKAFYNPVIAQSLRAGAQALLQCTGMGKLQPNLLVMGFKSNWKIAQPEVLEEYFNIIHDAFDLRYGVGILRLPEGLSTSTMLDNNDIEDIDMEEMTESGLYTPRILNRFHVVQVQEEKLSTSSEKSPKSEKPGKDANKEIEGYDNKAFNDKPAKNINSEKESGDDGTENTDRNNGQDKGTRSEKENSVNPVLLQVPTILANGQLNTSNLDLQERFRTSQMKGTIDVWWLFDDGGLTLLLPYLLTKKSHWKNCKLRIFSAASRPDALDRDQRHMATLLSKFRINYHDMTVIPDVGRKPSEKSLDEFKELIKDWMLDGEAGETPDTHPWKIQDVDISTQKERTYRHIRCRELLKVHSMDASLIVLTLPVPRKGLVSSGLYMAYLDTLTRDMPPILLLRGNQESVLTFYS